MPDDASIDRFRPRLPSPALSADEHIQAPGGAPGSPTELAVTSWDEWSHRDRDVRERRVLTLRIRRDRGVRSHAYAQAVAEHRERVRRATTRTVVAALPLAGGWIWAINSRSKAIAGEIAGVQFAPFAFVVYLTTVLVVVIALRRWHTIYQARPKKPAFVPLPDSPDSPRHGAFDGTTTPPTRW